MKVAYHYDTQTVRIHTIRSKEGALCVPTFFWARTVLFSTIYISPFLGHRNKILPFRFCRLRAAQVEPKFILTLGQIFILSYYLNNFAR